MIKEADFETVVEIILHHIDTNTLDDVFNESTLIGDTGFYLHPRSLVSVHRLENVKSTPEYYRKFISKK